MFNWLHKRAIQRLEVELAEVEAAIAEEERMMIKTRTCFPCVMADNAKQRARYLKKLEQLREKVNATS